MKKRRDYKYMSEILYGIVKIIAKLHDYIMHLNDAFEYNFNDKTMHFIVIGILGMMMLFVVYPLFKWLAEKKHVMVIAWIYVFTLIIVITFAIEIGQKITHTGNMEFADIMFGVIGFALMFIVFSVFRAIYHLIKLWILKKVAPEKEKKDEDEPETEALVIENNKANCIKEMSEETITHNEKEEYEAVYDKHMSGEFIDREFVEQVYEEIKRENNN